MNEKKAKFKIIFLLILFFGVFGWAENSEAAIINAASCEYNAVSSAVASANAEDTINVPAGNCTWANTLNIIKGINLIGAGSASTYITGSISPLIVYQPANKVANYRFRLSGFSFDFGDANAASRYGLLLNNGNGPPQTKVRIDHNIFKNAYNPISNYSGAMYGVIDNNTFDNFKYALRYSDCIGAYGDYVYENHPMFDYGLDNIVMWAEDNTFVNSREGLVDAQCASRYAFRYNNISINVDAYPVFDMHGNGWMDSEGRVGYSSQGGEIYGNNIVFSGSHGGRLFGQRGGKALWFYNNGMNMDSGYVQEEQPDSRSPVVNYPERTLLQHVHDSYSWSNMNNYTQRMSGPNLQYDCCPQANNLCNPACYEHADCCYNGANTPCLLENVQYWIDKVETFNGTSGVGCGTLANRPSTCTTGVGYWATNQSCSDLTGMVGANPTNSISGTLYKCAFTNTWTSYYTPLTYPHPLRNEGGGDTTPPASPVNFVVQ